MTRSRPNAPDLSVIVLVPDRFETVARTVRHLTGQTACDRLELVFVSPQPALAIPEDAVMPCWGWFVVSVDQLTSTSDARAAGIRRARARLVALVEDHCFPAPTWADALIRAHAEPWAGVGPAVFNANPATRVSWANLLIEYGPWIAPRKNAEWSHIPGHNSSYKRDVLMTCGERLGTLMEAESVLQWDLQRAGHRFTVERSAITRHENFSRFQPSLSLRFNAGRLFAANRRRDWPWPRRLLYAAGSPLLPILRTWRASRDCARVKSMQRRPTLLAVTFALLIADALGELTGYLAGAGHAMRRLTDLEFHRERFLTAQDRTRLRAPSSIEKAWPAEEM